jgi:hypothetical protein
MPGHGVAGEPGRHLWCIRAMVLRAASAMVLIVALGCSSTSSDVKGVASPSPITGGHLGSLGSAGCEPAAAFHPAPPAIVGGDALPEAGMDNSRGSFWALVYDTVPPRAGQEVKVTWRMTGAGDFAFRVSDLEGNTIPLTAGPVPHISSSWVHPGSEVGTGFKFPHAGCWQIHVAKPDVDADLWLAVVA